MIFIYLKDGRVSCQEDSSCLRKDRRCRFEGQVYEHNSQFKPDTCRTCCCAVSSEVGSQYSFPKYTKSFEGNVDIFPSHILPTKRFVREKYTQYRATR